MNNRQLLQRISQLQAGQPDAEWVKNTRAVLSSQISAGQYQPVDVKTNWQTLVMLFPTQLAVRVVAVLVLAVVLLMSTSITTVRANRSLPGDILYPVKQATEKVQLTLTFEPEDKAKLIVEFAGRRVDEAKQISQDDSRSDANKAKYVERSLRSYRDNIAKAKTTIDQIKTDTTKTAVVAEIENQMEDFTTSLKDQPQADEASIDVSQDLSNTTNVILIEKYLENESAVDNTAVKQSLVRKSQRLLVDLDTLQTLAATVSAEIDAGNNPGNISVLTIATVNSRLAIMRQQMQAVPDQVHGEQIHAAIEAIENVEKSIVDLTGRLRPAVPAASEISPTEG